MNFFSLEFFSGLPRLKYKLFRRFKTQQYYDKRITSDLKTTHDVGLFDLSFLNYIVLSDIIETVSGMPFETYIKQNIMQRLGMKSSGYSLNDDSLLRINFAPSYMMWVNIEHIPIFVFYCFLLVCVFSIDSWAKIFIDTKLEHPYESMKNSLLYGLEEHVIDLFFSHLLSCICCFPNTTINFFISNELYFYWIFRFWFKGDFFPPSQTCLSSLRFSFHSNIACWITHFITFTEQKHNNQIASSSIIFFFTFLNLKELAEWRSQFQWKNTSTKLCEIDDGASVPIAS